MRSSYEPSQNSVEQFRVDLWLHASRIWNDVDDELDNRNVILCSVFVFCAKTKANHVLHIALVFVFSLLQVFLCVSFNLRQILCVNKFGLHISAFQVALNVRLSGSVLYQNFWCLRERERKVFCHNKPRHFCVQAQTQFHSWWSLTHISFAITMRIGNLSFSHICKLKAVPPPHNKNKTKLFVILFLQRSIQEMKRLQLKAKTTKRANNAT